MHILCIETTSTNCSIALAHTDGGFKNDFHIKHCQDLIEDQSDNYSHGERLHVSIDQLLKRNNLKPQDLSAIAVSAGPGSYTGLRIGVASAKGLCYSLSIPLIAIDTLTALSYQSIDRAASYTIAFLDARRMEVYARVFKNNKPITAVEARILDENSFSDILDEKTTIIGTGVEKFKNLLPSSQNQFINSLPTALTLCDLAIDKFKTNDIVEDIAYFEPFYLKEFRVG